MPATLVATVGHGSTALWYLTRATGLVSLILLSATVVLGTVASVGWTTSRWPRFLSQSVHRNLSLFCLALIGIHIVSTVGDGYVPIGFADAVIPFRSPYRPIWVGLGALAFDMLLAVALTSALRRRIGVAAWRGVHWLAYACWPIAAVHGLGSGSDARLPGATLVFVGLRRLGRRRGRLAPRGGASALGDLAGRGEQSGRRWWCWSSPPLRRRARSDPAGHTGRAPLRRCSPSCRAPTTASYPATTATTAPPASTAVRAGTPATPFSTSVTGTVTQSAPDAHGQSVVTLTMRLANTSAPLRVTIIGSAENGGVAMRRSAVSFGSSTGQVTALEGSDIGALVSGPAGSINLTMNLALDPAAGTLTGQVSGGTGQ